jgi:hypothetical protein
MKEKIFPQTMIYYTMLVDDGDSGGILSDNVVLSK